MVSPKLPCKYKIFTVYIKTVKSTKVLGHEIISLAIRYLKNVLWVFMVSNSCVSPPKRSQLLLWLSKILSQLWNYTFPFLSYGRSCYKFRKEKDSLISYKGDGKDEDPLSPKDKTSSRNTISGRKRVCMQELGLGTISLRMYGVL